MQADRPTTPANASAASTPTTGVGTPGASAPAPPAAPAGAHAAQQTLYVAAASQGTGDARIDRMLALEQALKRFGSPV